jgi:hypothetical protein
MCFQMLLEHFLMLKVEHGFYEVKPRFSIDTN